MVEPDGKHLRRLRRLADVPRRGRVSPLDGPDHPPRDAGDRGRRHPPGRARPRRLGLFQQVAPAHVRRMGQHRMAAGHGRVGQAGTPGDGRVAPALGPDDRAPGLRFPHALPRRLHHLRSVSVLASPLRPLACNVQRFYFPECKPFELAVRGVDQNHRLRFWNAVGSFGTVLSAGHGRHSARERRRC